MTVNPLFLDDDIDINRDHGYVHRCEEFDFIEGIFYMARQACKQSHDLIAIANQVCIAHGYCTENRFHQLTDWTREQFIEAGAPISMVYSPPFRPAAGPGKYLKYDYSRRSYSEMIKQDQKDLSIDLSGSALIGNKISDMQAGIAAGVGTNLLFAEGCPNKLDGLNYQPIITLREAISYLQRGAQ